MSHNQQLKSLLAEIGETALRATGEKDFSPIFAKLREFQSAVGPIKFDNRLKWLVFAVISVLGGGFALLYFTADEFQAIVGDAGFFILGGFALALITTLVVIGLADSDIDRVSDLIFDRDLLYDNRLTPIDLGDGGHDLYRKYAEAFGDFRHRGDEDRYVQRLVRGQWSGTDYSFTYDYYVFHYVRVYHVPVTRMVGKTTVTSMERRTQTLYRYGLILDFPLSPGLAVRSSGGSYDYPVEFHPASEEFERVYAIGAESTMVAAKFLKPAVVLALLEMGRAFSDLNLEITRDGRMNIAFSDSDILDLQRRHSIAQPEEFEREIQSHLALPRLKRLLQFVETLKRHNDSNF